MGLVIIQCKLLILMVGERGFEPPTPWSRTNNRFTNLLSRLGLFCVFHPVSPRYSAANGPNLDPSLTMRSLFSVRTTSRAVLGLGAPSARLMTFEL